MEDSNKPDWNVARAIIFGPEESARRHGVKPPKSHRDHVAEVWSNKNVDSFGVERVFRLLLVLVAYGFPGIYIRAAVGASSLNRKLATDAYVVIKTLISLLILVFDLRSPYVLGIVIYFVLDTFLYTLGLLFLSDIYKPPISSKRSYLLTFFNYVELCLSFAVFYRATGEVKYVGSPFDAAYFSFVTAFTIGYGDMVPTGTTAKALVLIQASVLFSLVTLVFARLVTDFDRRSGLTDRGSST